MEDAKSLMRMDWILELDKQLFLAINGWHSESWDGIMWWVSGKTTWWPFYFLLLGFLGWKKGWQLVPMILFLTVVLPSSAFKLTPTSFPYKFPQSVF